MVLDISTAHFDTPSTGVDLPGVQASGFTPFRRNRREVLALEGDFACEFAFLEQHGVHWLPH